MGAAGGDVEDGIDGALFCSRPVSPFSAGSFGPPNTTLTSSDRPGVDEPERTDLAPILIRLQINPEQWIDTVTNFGRLFRTAVGRARAMKEQAARMGRRWLYGNRYAATAFT